MYRLVLLNTLAAHYSRTGPPRKDAQQVFFYPLSAGDRDHLQGANRARGHGPGWV